MAESQMAEKQDSPYMVEYLNWPNFKRPNGWGRVELRSVRARLDPLGPAHLLAHLRPSIHPRHPLRQIKNS